MLLNLFSGFKSPSTVILTLQALLRSILLLLKIVQDAFMVLFSAFWKVFHIDVHICTYMFWLNLTFSWFNTLWMGMGYDEMISKPCQNTYECFIATFGHIDLSANIKQCLNVVLESKISFVVVALWSLYSPLQPLLDSPLLDNLLVIYTNIVVAHTCFL